MLENIHPKYTLSVTPKENRPYNPVHDYVRDATATIVDLKIGQRGWIAYSFAPDDWHRLHTSTVEDIQINENGGVTVTTRNTVYTLTKNLLEE